MSSMHSHVQYIKSLPVKTHFEKKNLVLTEEGQEANDTIIQSTPVGKSHSQPQGFDDL